MTDNYFAEAFFSKKIDAGPEIEVQTQVIVKSAKDPGDLNKLKHSEVKVLLEAIEAIPASEKETELRFIKKMVCKNLLDNSIMLIKIFGKINIEEVR